MILYCKIFELPEIFNVIAKLNLLDNIVIGIKLNNSVHGRCALNYACN